MTELIKVDFHGDTIYALKDGDSTRVAIKEISDRLGLDWSAQFRRINRNPILKTCIAIMATQMPGDDQTREVVTLPIQYLNGWLFGIQVSRVAPELQAVVLIYQRECYDVLFRHFFGKRQEDRRGPTFADLENLIDRVVERRLADAVRQLKGATWGMTKGQTAHHDSRFDRVDLDNTEIHADLTDGFTAVKSKLREEDWWEIRRVLEKFNIVTDRSYSARISHKLVSFLAGKSASACRKSPNNGKTWQFDINAAIAWRETEGKAEIDGRILAAQEAEQEAKRKASRQMGLFGDNVLPISQKPKKEVPPKAG